MISKIKKRINKANFNQNQAQSKLIDINATTRNINESEAVKLTIWSLLSSFEIENWDVQNIIRESGSIIKAWVLLMMKMMRIMDSQIERRIKNFSIPNLYINQKIKYWDLCSEELILKLRTSIYQINRIKRMNLNQIRGSLARNFIKL